jgi:hypothetical protein
MGEGDQAVESSVAFEPPDVVVWTLVGDIGLNMLLELREEQERIAKGWPYVLVLLDVSRVGSVSAAARTEATRKRDTTPRGIAYVGASFHLRVLATLLSKAASLLNKISEDPPRFFATKAEAFAWLEERRRQIHQGK